MKHQYKLYGVQVSLFVGKLRGYLNYKGLDYQEKAPTIYDLLRRFPKKVGDFVKNPAFVVVLFFENAKAMEAAYGLSIVITMIMTSILLSNFLVLRRYPNWLIYCILAVFLTIEFSFLVANLLKFMHGGYVTLIMAAILSSVMFIWMISQCLSLAALIL